LSLALEGILIIKDAVTVKSEVRREGYWTKRGNYYKSAGNLENKGTIEQLNQLRPSYLNCFVLDP